jgi:hypothetical protein
MLQGQWPEQGCQYCKVQEEKGGISDRQFQLLEQQDPGLTPPELYHDKSATEITPTMLEIYFSNKCNQKCIYCGPHFSSLWEQEVHKYGEMPQYKIKSRRSLSKEEYATALTNLWKYLEKNSTFKHLRRFGIVGGEPFLQEEEINQTLDFWEENPNPDLILYFISNLNVPQKLMSKYYARLERLVSTNKVWKVQITASLDGWGKEQEYTRYGLDLELFEKNFVEIIKQPWATVSINSTISALTIKTMPEMYGKINHWNSLRPNGHDKIIHSFNTVEGTPDTPNIFGKDVFEHSFDLVLAAMPNQTISEINIIEHMKSIKLKLSNSPKNPVGIEKLKQYLDTLDSRRGTDWKKTFPWLIEFN